MLRRISLRVLPAIVLLSLLGTGAAQAFCFLKNSDRRANHAAYPMPAIGFSPALLRDHSYGYSAAQPAWYAGDRGVLPQQPLPYEGRYGTIGDLQR